MRKDDRMDWMSLGGKSSGRKNGIIKRLQIKKLTKLVLKKNRQSRKEHFCNLIWAWK